MKPNKQPDWDEVAAHNAGKGGDEVECFFCLSPVHVDDLAGPPEGSSQEIADMYMQRQRCMSCDLDIRMRLNAAMIKGIESVFASGKPKTEERSEDEKKALDEIFAGQDREALTELEVDRLADESGDGRYWP